MPASVSAVSFSFGFVLATLPPHGPGLAAGCICKTSAASSRLPVRSLRRARSFSFSTKRVQNAGGGCMNSFELKPSPGPEELARAAAKDWLDLVALAAGPHLVAVSGGRIAKTHFQAVKNLAGASTHPLQNVDFFWADERCVPLGHPDSNFLLANEQSPPTSGHRAAKNPSPQGRTCACRRCGGSQRRNSPPRAENAAGLPILDLIFLAWRKRAHCLADAGSSASAGQLAGALRQRGKVTQTAAQPDQHDLRHPCGGEERLDAGLGFRQIRRRCANLCNPAPPRHSPACCKCAPARSFIRIFRWPVQRLN